MNPRIQSKGQMEIMGLVIIIVLLLIGMLFVIRFTLLTDSKSVKDTFKEKEMIANFVNAMRMTTIQECKGASMEQLLIDAADDQDISIECPGVNGAGAIGDLDDLHTFIQDDFLNPTLNKWAIAYTLSFSNDAGNPIPALTFYHVPDKQDQWCTTDHIGAGKPYSRKEKDQKPIPLGGGRNMFVNIEICS